MAFFNRESFATAGLLEYISAIASYAARRVAKYFQSNRKRLGKLTMRIYALAKKLEKSNKELLDACKELGINGKSNLASLSDEEAKRVTAYFRELEEARKAGDDSKFEMVRPAPSQHIPSGSGRTGKPVVLQPNPNRVLFFGNKREQRPAVEPAKASNEEAPKIETPVVEQAVDKKPEEKEEVSRNWFFIRMN